MRTMAVLSGVVSLEQMEKIKAENHNSELIPDFYAASVKDLFECL